MSSHVTYCPMKFAAALEDFALVHTSGSQKEFHYIIPDVCNPHSLHISPSPAVDMAVASWLRECSFVNATGAAVPVSGLAVNDLILVSGLAHHVLCMQMVPA